MTIRGRKFQPAMFAGLAFVHAGAGVALWQMFHGGFPLSAWVLLGVLYMVTVLGITLCYHRLMTHKAYECPRWLKRVLYACTAPSLEGPGSEWGPTHYRHHVFSDHEGDPHRPDDFNGGFRGLLWSHMGWLVFEFAPAPAGYETPAHFETDPDIRWQKKYYWPLASLGFLVPLATAGWEGLLLAGFLRIVVCWHVTWAVNSFCHVFGSPAMDNDGNVLASGKARNFPRLAVFWVLAFISGGEFWHANHHARQRSAYLGWRWYEVDPGGWCIRVFEKMGLAWNVRKPENISSLKIESAVL